MHDGILPSIILALPLGEIRPEQRIDLTELNNESLIECHRHTSMALYARVFRKTEHSLPQLHGGLEFVHCELLRRLEGRPLAAPNASIRSGTGPARAALNVATHTPQGSSALQSRPTAMRSAQMAAPRHHGYEL